jgi:hypothetical protein
VRAVLVMVVLLLGVVGPRPLSPPAASAASFCDVAPGAPYYDAVMQLAARGIIGGYENGCFGPNDPTNRAQMAALIARAMGWAGEDHGNQFADRCDPAQGCVDDNLWRNVGTLQYRQVTRGYDATTYGPHNLVVQQQVLLFISRAMVQKGAWQRQADNPAVYPNLPRGTDAERRDAADIATYVHYVGSAPDAPSGISWTTYGQASARAWFARALWQVLAKFPVGPAPSTSPPSGPTLGVSPSSGVAGTQFAVSVSGAPAGATIAWAFTYGGAQTNSGAFALNPGQTAFTFIADSTGSNAGVWTLTFWANGTRLGAVSYTVTASYPPGWQAWHGLPLPGYFEYRSEGPSNSAPGCTVVVFYHHLSDGQIETVREQIRAAWWQVGIVSTRHQHSSLSNADEYYSQHRTGLVAWNTSRTTAIVDRSTVYIWDCPR